MTKAWRRLIGGVVQIPINSGGPQVYLAEDSNGHVLAKRSSGTTKQNIRIMDALPFVFCSHVNLLFGQTPWSMPDTSTIVRIVKAYNNFHRIDGPVNEPMSNTFEQTDQKCW
jgi:hypothetical protein